LFFRFAAHGGIIWEAHVKKAIAPLVAVLWIALACSGAMADWSWKGWKGHHTKLFDARNACKNTDSLECEPFLAAAVAVAEVFGNSEARRERRLYRRFPRCDAGSNELRALKRFRAVQAIYRPSV
jgi:hypothetical protein